MLESKKYRLAALAVLALFWMLAIWARLFNLQILRYGYLATLAKRQQEHTIDVPPLRGAILDRNYHTLAMTVQVDSVTADPREMKDVDAAVTLLSRILQLDPAALRARLESHKGFVWVKHRITPEEAAQVRELSLHGIYLTKEATRSYPQNELAAHVLGFVDGDQHGEAGLEYKYNKQVEGVPGKVFMQRDGHSQYFGRRASTEVEPGDNLILTLDETIQAIAEKELAQGMADTHAKAGTVLVMDPRNGEILALANQPTFNPNAWKDSPREVWLNRAVNGMYEPGSTMKIVTLSAALEEGLTTPEERIDCQMGAINVFGRIVHDHKKFGVLTVSEIMEKSSDVGSIKLGMRLGNDKMFQYMTAFGLGQKTGVELPGEEGGIARPPARWTKSSIGSIAMGQELAATPVQIAASASVIADIGVWHRPHIVREVAHPKGLPAAASHSVVQAAAPDSNDSRRVISQETALKIRRMLQLVVLQGTGPKAKLKGYTSAGKSGTAQKFDPRIHMYSPTDYVASFVGFAPVNENALTIAVILDSPVGGHHGGEVSAPIFKRVAEQVLAYRNVPLDLPVDDRTLKAQKTAEKIDPEQLRDALDAPASAGNQPQTLPAALLDASIEQAAQAPADFAVVDLGGSVTAPDFTGKSARKVAEIASSRGLVVDMIGSGIVREQSPAPGGRLLPGRRITVRLGR